MPSLSNEWDALFQRLGSLSYIELYDSYLCNRLSEFCAVMSKNTSIIEANLNWNHFKPDDGQILGQMLQQNNTISRLYLSSNTLADAGAESISIALQQNTGLAYLAMADNSIHDLGAEKIAESLTKNHSLTHLDLSDNSIGETGISYLSQALKKNHALLELRLAGNSPKYQEIIQEYLKRNEELRDKLHTAAQTNNIREATALIQQGVSLISTSGNDANTPLHWAVINDHKEMIAMLIKSMQAKKIPLHQLNNEGQTAQDLAYNKPEILALFNESSTSSELPPNSDDINCLLKQAHYWSSAASQVMANVISEERKNKYGMYSDEGAKRFEQLTILQTKAIAINLQIHSLTNIKKIQQTINDLVEIVARWMKFSSFIGTIPSYNPEDRKREQQQALQNSSGVTQNMLDATVAALNSAIEKTENITIDTAIRQTLKTIQQNLEKLQSLKSNKDIRDKVIVQFREIQSILTIIELTNSINTAVLNVFSNTKQQNFFHYSLTREQAETLLKTRAQGTFLFRKSSQPNSVAISFLEDDHQKIMHLLVALKNDHITIGNDLSFSNLTDCLKNYSATLTQPVATTADETKPSKSVHGNNINLRLQLWSSITEKMLAYAYEESAKNRYSIQEGNEIADAFSAARKKITQLQESMKKIETRYDSQEIINSFIEVFNSWKDFKAHYGSLPTFDLAKQAEEAREELERIQVIQDELLNVTQLLLEDILANIQILDDIAQNNVKKIQEKFQKLIKNTKEANIKDELFKLYSELNEISAPIEMAHIINQAITTTSPNTDGTSSSYYHNLTREESERVLKGKTPGCFLFRKSSQPNSISLSYMYADKTIRHALLQHSNGNFVYMDKSYSNLAEFLLAYKETLTTPLARISATSANNNNATKQSYQKPPAAPSMQTVELSVISSIEEVKRAQNTLKTQLDELSQLETNIKSLLKTKGNYSNFNEEERLKTELKKIQEQHAVLWGDYQAVQIKAQAIEAFKQYPNQWEYYHFFYIVFEEFFTGCKAAASLLLSISKEGNLADHAGRIDIVGKIVSFFPLLGRDIENVLGKISDVLKSIDHKQVIAIIQSISRIGTSDEIKVIISETAFNLTQRYADNLSELLSKEETGQQPLTLPNDSLPMRLAALGKHYINLAKESVYKQPPKSQAEALAIFALNLIVGAFFDLRIELDGNFVNQFLSVISQPPKKRYAIQQILLETFAETLVTKTQKRLLMADFYRKPGIKVDDENYFAGNGTDPDKYGFRHGTMEEVVSLALTKVNTPNQTIPSKPVTTAQPISSLVNSKSPISHSDTYQQLTRQLVSPVDISNKADKKEIEQLKQDYEEKLQQQEEKLKRQEAALKKMRSKIEELAKQNPTEIDLDNGSPVLQIQAQTKQQTHPANTATAKNRREVELEKRLRYNEKILNIIAEKFQIKLPEDETELSDDDPDKQELFSYSNTLT